MRGEERSQVAEGPFRTVLRIALRDALSVDATRRERGWKLLMLAPCMLLFRPARGGVGSREKIDFPVQKIFLW